MLGPEPTALSSILNSWRLVLEEIAAGIVPVSCMGNRDDTQCMDMGKRYYLPLVLLTRSFTAERRSRRCFAWMLCKNFLLASSSCTHRLPCGGVCIESQPPAVWARACAQLTQLWLMPSSCRLGRTQNLLTRLWLCSHALAGLAGAKNSSPGYG